MGSAQAPETRPLRALVTGAARPGSIGQAIVARLEKAGMIVETLDKLPGCTYQVDLVSDELPDLSHIDVFVGNAAVTNLFGAAHTFSLEKWNLDIAVSLTGNLRVLQAVLPGMRERKFGRIIFISSTAINGMPAQVSYATTKSALLGMMKTVAAETVTLGITANAVLPGPTASSNLLGAPKEILDAWRETLPNGFVAPEDIAAAVAFFASPRARSVTGQILTVDGGDGLNLRSMTRTMVNRRAAGPA